MGKLLVSMMPPVGNWFVDAFAGRGNVTWAAMTCRMGYKQWWMNDLYTADFLRAIQTHGAAIEIPLTIPAMRHQYKNFFTRIKKDGLPHTIESLLLEPHVSRGGGGYSGGGPASTGNAKAETFAATLRTCHDLMCEKRPIVTAYGWRDLPWNKFGHRDLVFLDPPYYNADVRCYDPLPEQDYVDMVKLLSKARFKWMLTEYRDRFPLYVKVLGEPIYTKQTTSVVSNDGSIRNECIWTNY